VSLQLDLSEIVSREGMRSAVYVDQAGVEDPDLNFASPLRGALTFVNGGDLISIEGSLATELQAECSRCLTPVRLPLSVAIDERYPIPDILNPTRKPAPDEDFDPTIRSVVYLEKGRPILDLDELMRQLLVAELPIRILCSEECRGLCPGCGALLNEQPCTCSAPVTDGSQAVLRDLLEPRSAADRGA